VLSEAAVENDVIQIYTLKNFRVPNTYTIGQTDDQFLTKTSASSTYLSQSSASTTYAPVAAGGLVLLNTTSFTAQSTVSIDNVFSSTYKAYKIVFDCLPSTTLDLGMRLRVGGSDNSTSNYNRQYLLGNSTTVAAARSNGQTSWAINGGASAHRQLHEMLVVNPNQTLSTGAYLAASANYDNTSANIAIINNYSFSATTVFTGFSIITSTGNLTGFVSVYGYKE
jgi:hypothetical protein